MEFNKIVLRCKGNWYGAGWLGAEYILQAEIGSEYIQYFCDVLLEIGPLDRA